MKNILQLAIFILLFHTLNAQTVTIYRAGLPLTPTYTTLKAALPNTINGDEVRLSAHTFNEYNDTVRSKIILKGTISGLDTTILDGKGLGPVLIMLSIAATDTQIVQDIVITGGYNPVSSFTYYSGGGIAAFCNLLLKGNVTIRNNISNGSGGGISNIGNLYLYGGEVIGTSKIKIIDNKTISPLGQGGGISNESGNVFITGNLEVFNNEAYRGGGLYILRPKLSKCVFDSKSAKVLISNNSAKEQGGGIYFNAPAAIPGEIGNGTQLNGNIIIEGNTANGKGGGICNNDSATFNGPGIQIINNQASGGGGGIYGGPKSKGGYTILNNVTFSGNTTALRGGGIYVDYYHEMQINNCNIINNQASGTKAANAIHNDNKLTIMNCRVYNPTASGARQLEVHNNNIMSSSQCWWGESDTTGLVYFNNASLGSSFTLSNWVVANWSVNNGSPVGAASSYPIDAQLRLNTGAALPASSFAMLQGKYSAGSGSFSPSTANISSANKISSSYIRPASGISILWAVIDADSFKSNSDGLSVKELNNVSSKYKIYPNPSTGILFVEGIQQNTKAIIMDLQSKVLQQLNLSAQQNLLDLSEYPIGLYILKLSNNSDHSEAFKITKE